MKYVFALALFSASFTLDLTELKLSLGQLLHELQTASHAHADQSAPQINGRAESGLPCGSGPGSCG